MQTLIIALTVLLSAAVGPASAQAGGSSTSTDSSTGTSANTGSQGSAGATTERKTENRSSDNPGTATGSHNQSAPKPNDRDGYKDRPH